VNELLDIELPETDWDTVGGLMFGVLGHVPVEGETVDFQGLEFRAERVQRRRILTVRITPKESEPAESSAT
jgi:putative hemolysin